MGFVKSPDEIEAISQVLQQPAFLTDRFSVQFHTTTEFIADVLPPGLDPIDQPLAVISMSRCQSLGCGPFNVARVYVSCAHRGQQGLYAIWMMTDSDPANQLGRDLWGESKKVGTAAIYHEPAGIHGQAFRNGALLIDMDADLGEVERPDGLIESIAYELKAQPATSGRGLQYDPALVAMHTRDEFFHLREGPASLRLTGTAHDPLGDIPIVEVLGGTHLLADSWTTASEVATFTDRNAYVPYVYGRNFDDFVHLPRPRRYRESVVGRSR